MEPACAGIDAGFAAVYRMADRRLAQRFAGKQAHVATDSASQVYVTDPEAHRVLIFDAAGFYLGRFGRFGPEIDNFNIPNGIAIEFLMTACMSRTFKIIVLKFAPVGALLPPVAPASAEQ